VITPLIAENIRGRATGVDVATVDGLLPGMLRYMIVVYKSEKEKAK
jgi:hypothetical protein